MAADAERRARSALIVRDMDRYWTEKEAAEKHRYAQEYSDREMARSQAEAGGTDQHVQGISGKKYLKADVEDLRRIAADNGARVHVSDESLAALESSDVEQSKHFSLVGDEAAVLATYEAFKALMTTRRAVRQSAASKVA